MGDGIKKIITWLFQIPVGSAAVRALSGFGNGASNSRPSTPTSSDFSHNPYANQRLTKLMAEKSSFLQQNQFQQLQKSTCGVEEEMRLLDIDQNGKNDSWQEDQEVIGFFKHIFVINFKYYYVLFLCRCRKS